MNLSTRAKIIRHSNAVAAGSTVITPAAGIDTEGFDGVLFIVHFGTIVAAAVTSIEAHTSKDDGSSDSFTAILGTKVTVADDDDNKVAWLDIHRPLERYVKCIVNRATQNATLDAIIAILYDATDMPTTHDVATVLGGELHVSAIEGTA